MCKPQGSSKSARSSRKLIENHQTFRYEVVGSRKVVNSVKRCYGAIVATLEKFMKNLMSLKHLIDLSIILT